MTTRNRSERYTADHLFTTQLKGDIIHYLQQIPLNTPWGFACRDFAENQHTKTNEDFTVLLSELYDDILISPFMMRKILGATYHFFGGLA